MPRTPDQIYQWFNALRAAAKTVAGSDLPPNEKQVVQDLCTVGLAIGETIVIDLNRIANALECLADLERQRHGLGIASR